MRFYYNVFIDMMYDALMRFVKDRHQPKSNQQRYKKKGKKRKNANAEKDSPKSPNAAKSTN